ncbi:TrbI/VirB10 family protein [Wolbachia endosymbiont of Dirofilaria (Dirofilaria) immitis]|uniref:Type IV secretion system protein virB10 n=1 Tax=Wolbachia endosymbiont of Dirofilaria immitis TaxID=82301 RepID=A4V6P9_9RICK|nr:TrbI/VirB10 family protein [Wolbachia endosymbiont of Dirofilaria (Dirofilaria) immitis]QKX02379.1 type VI secretion protein [Wolbachia endosymbiont of Dirofilaria (Dirofilaria) immitis]CAJ41434.1 type IV secretion system protein virB10 [Wolbachia endosymbiont of Dirofilaria immitis]
MNKDRHNNSENESEIESKVVIVGSSQSYRILIIIVLVFLVGGVYYYLYFNPFFNKENIEIIKKEEVKQSVQELKEKLEKVPDDTMVHERIITDLPSLPPLPIPQIIPEVKQVKKEKVLKKEEEKPKETHVSNIPVLPKQNFPYSSVNSNLPTSLSAIGSSGYPKDRRGAQMLAMLSNEKEAANAILADTSAQLNTATKIGKLGFVIAQGKIIDAVLETAIDSDLQGVLRAIVSGNVYAEAGDTVLIPKGSRLIGSYSFDSDITRARININWNRIILPHGIDITISSLGTDKLGRAGITGMIDNKVVSALFSSILLAGVSISSAIIAQKASNLIDVFTAMNLVRSIAVTEIDISPLKDIIGKKSSSKEDKERAKNDEWKLEFGAIRKIKNASDEQSLLKIFKQVVKDLELTSIDDNKVDEITLEDIKLLLQRQENKSIYEESIKKLINDFSRDMRDIVSRYTNKKPIIYVDQGTALRVFVNQDIVFSPQVILNQ